jgi:hypothetical protein
VVSHAGVASEALPTPPLIHTLTAIQSCQRENSAETLQKRTKSGPRIVSVGGGVVVNVLFVADCGCLPYRQRDSASILSAFTSHSR